MADRRDEGKYWLARARNALSASEALVSKELFDDAISRAYYAMFYAAKALLIRDGVSAGSKHSAVLLHSSANTQRKAKLSLGTIRCLSRILSGGKRQTTTFSGMLIVRRLRGALQMRASSFL